MDAKTKIYACNSMNWEKEPNEETTVNLTYKPVEDIIKLGGEFQFT